MSETEELIGFRPTTKVTTESLIGQRPPQKKPTTEPLPHEEEIPFSGKYPSLYGIYGATKETAKALIPYSRYIDPEERERFQKATQQEQTRELLLQNLEAVLLLGFKPIAEGASPVFKALFPKTHKFLTTPLKLGAKQQKTVAQRIGAYREKHGELPKADVIEGWWKQAGGDELSGAQKVEAMYDEAGKVKTPKKSLYKELKTKFVDVSGNVKSALLKKGDLGKQAVIQHDLIAGATPAATMEYDELAKAIYGKLSSSEEELLHRIIQSRRTISIENTRKIKNPKGLGGSDHQHFLDSIPTETFTKLNRRADTYFEVMSKQLDDMLDEGLINPKVYKALKDAGDYSPRKFLHHIDDGAWESKKISVASSGIKSLAAGSEELLEKNSRLLLSQVLGRTRGRVFRNRANNALYNLAQAEPENGIVKLSEVVRKTKTGKPIYQKAPNGWEKLSVMVKGQHKELLMPKGLAKEWVVRDPAISLPYASFLGWVSGSKILKPMATGLNPEFALKNLPRDIAHAWLTTDEYSSFMPKAAFQFARDFASVTHEAMFKTGAWKSYIDEGGGMEFLTHQGRLTSKTGGALSKIQGALGWLGETSEVMTRLALRRRALRNGASPSEATWIARNYLDFSQGGSYTKAADAALPYLNAGVQGTRGIVRAGMQRPQQFAYKTAQIGTLASGLYLANSHQNPEALEQISKHEKVNNWIITTPFSFKDKQGTKRHFYFKIAKDQGQRIFATLAENLMVKYMGGEVDVDEVTEAAKSAMAWIPNENIPPSLDAILGYSANKDFWRNKDIWHGSDVEPSAEFTRFTHPAFVKFGEKTGLSPEKTRYALSQMFTNRNIYTSLAGYGWKTIMDELPEREKNLVTEQVIQKQPFVRSIMGVTEPFNAQRKQLEEESIKENTAKHLRTVEFDKLSQDFYDGSVSEEDVFALARKQPSHDVKRFIKRHQRRGMLQDLPERRWWLELLEVESPEARATVFWNRWRNSNREEREFLSKYSKKTGVVKSKRFNRRLKALKNK